MGWLGAPLLALGQVNRVPGSHERAALRCAAACSCARSYICRPGIEPSSAACRLPVLCLQRA